ncbi:Phenylalanyl-tRNA synthetase [Paraphoma chrysanthemicola]|nr:Phenylalanyl-tRNA synthetase [Paraphoma chrysanthemicola]
MPTPSDPAQYLSTARVDPSVFALRPDYRALLLIATNIPTSPSTASSEAFLSAAESSAKAALATTPLNSIPHVVAWREAYKAFGAKPKKTKPSVEALLGRVDAGLPRVNRLTDIYNAISIKHQIPLGGEDLDKYAGAPFLIRATGSEKFVTKSGGEEVTEYPKPGEVVWCDDEGVTCRLWNWRQCARTGLRDETTSVLFIMDALEPVNDEGLEAAAEELTAELKKLGGEVQVCKRLIRAP